MDRAPPFAELGDLPVGRPAVQRHAPAGVARADLTPDPPASILVLLAREALARLEITRVHPRHDPLRSERIDPAVRAAQARAREISQALRAAGLGDLRTLQRLFDDGLSLTDGDYDRRTPMHLAAAEGQVDVVRFLLDRSIDPNARDRWGGTPLGDAEFGDHSNIVALLREHGAESGQ